MRVAGGVLLAVVALALTVCGIGIMVAAGLDVSTAGRIGTGLVFLVCALALGAGAAMTWRR